MNPSEETKWQRILEFIKQLPALLHPIRLWRYFKNHESE